MSAFLNGSLENLWRASWQGGLLILAVWAFCAGVKKATKKAVPAQARYWLFWIATVQLPLRLLFAVPVPIAYPPATRPVKPAPRFETDRVPSPSSFSQASQEPLVVVEAAPQTEPEPPPEPIRHAPPSRTNPSLTPGDALAGAYLAGLVMSLVSQAVRLIRTVQLIRRARPIIQQRPKRLLRQAATAAGIPQKRTLTLIESDDAPCPLLSGLICPKIVLPSAAWKGLDDDELGLALAHEVAHLRRSDLWWDVPTAASRALFYFHPLVRLASREMILACEEACDLEALRATGGSRAQYAKLLVRFAQGNLGFLGMGSSAGYGLLQRRLEMLKGNIKYVGSQRYRWALVIASTAVLSTPFSVVRAQSVPSPSQATPAVPASARIPATPHAGTPPPPASIGIPSRPVATSTSPKHALPAKHAAKNKLAKSALAPKAMRPAAAPLRLIPPPPVPQKPSDQVSFQWDQEGHMRLTARFDSTPLRQALVDLFEAAQVNYSIKSGLLPDTVTCSLHNARLSEVLQAIFQSVRQPLSYRVEGQGETWFVVPAERSAAPPSPASPYNAGMPPANIVEVSPTTQRDGVRPDMNEVIPSVVADQADVRGLLRALFKNRGNYTIDPFVQGIVTLDLKNVSMQMVLQDILRQVNSTYRVDGGVVQIVHREG